MQRINVLSIQRTSAADRAKIEGVDPAIQLTDAGGWYDGEIRETSEICASIGVSERTLRLCCAEFLGMAPSEYARLRRMNLVRAALRHAESYANLHGRRRVRHELCQRFCRQNHQMVSHRLRLGDERDIAIRRPRSPRQLDCEAAVKGRPRDFIANTRKI
jgi:hypothetical protein